MFAAILIILCFILIIGLVVLTYFGMFHKIEIKVGPPPVGDFVAFYKYRMGPYQECHAVFIELSALVPSTVDQFGIYYDDPKVVSSLVCIQSSTLRCYGHILKLTITSYK